MNVFSRRHPAGPRWYLGVCCNKCQGPILFALDHSEGVDGSTRPTTARLILTCTREGCGHRADYTTATVLRLLRSPGEAPDKTDSRRSQSPRGRRTALAEDEN